MLEERAQDLALKWRKKFGIEGQLNLDALTLIYKAKNAGLIAGYKRILDDQMPSDEAAFDNETRILLIAERTFRAAANGDYRAKFTICHELGHAAFNHKTLRHRGTSSLVHNIASNQKRIHEKEANAFASAFLMPFNLIDNPSNAEANEISERFQVSLSAARIRVEEARAMENRKSGGRRQPPREVVEYLNEKKKMGHRVTSIDD